MNFGEKFVGPNEGFFLKIKQSIYMWIHSLILKFRNASQSQDFRIKSVLFINSKKKTKFGYFSNPNFVCVCVFVLIISSYLETVENNWKKNKISILHCRYLYETVCSSSTMCPCRWSCFSHYLAHRPWSVPIAKSSLIVPLPAVMLHYWWPLESSTIQLATLLELWNTEKMYRKKDTR